MTRIEKYADYRKQILNEDAFLSVIDTESSIINSYRKKIMDLNPNILINEADDIQWFTPTVPLVSVNQMDPSVFQKIKNFSNLIDTQQEEKIIKDISDLIFSYEHNSIISNDNKSIAHEWLVQDKNYLKLEEIDKELKTAQKELLNFQQVSIQKLSKLMETIKNSENSKLDIGKYEVSTNVVKTSISYKKLYIGIIFTLVILMVAIIVLIVVGVLVYV